LADFGGRGDATDDEEITNGIPGLEDEGRPDQRTHQMCSIGADFKHFYGARPLRISAIQQGLVNHALNFAPGDIGLTSLFKSKRTERH
jgi:hypothetical protein